jgi:hypothetical protein
MSQHRRVRIVPVSLPERSFASRNRRTHFIALDALASQAAQHNRVRFQNMIDRKTKLLRQQHAPERDGASEEKGSPFPVLSTQ